jgi:hypothetical protein
MQWEAYPFTPKSASLFETGTFEAIKVDLVGRLFFPVWRWRREKAPPRS